MLNLKKKLITIALSLFCAGQLMAVPALPGKMVAKQADGTMITIQKLGDEHYHMTVTEDGYPLKYNFATNNYEYAELTEQGLVSSNIVAMPVAQRDARAKAYLQKLDKEVMMQIAEKQFSAAKVNAFQSVAAKKSNANGPKRVKISNVPTTGKQKVLNILVEFSNCKFSMSDPKAYYDRFFHEKGFNENGCYGSVHDYYYEGSGHNYDPDIDCYGPIRAMPVAKVQRTHTRWSRRPASSCISRVWTSLRMTPTATAWSITSMSSMPATARPTPTSPTPSGRTAGTSPPSVQTSSWAT